MLVNTLSSVYTSTESSISFSKAGMVNEIVSELSIELLGYTSINLEDTIDVCVGIGFHRWSCEDRPSDELTYFDMLWYVDSDHPLYTYDRASRFLFPILSVSLLAPVVICLAAY